MSNVDAEKPSASREGSIIRVYSMVSNISFIDNLRVTATLAVIPLISGAAIPAGTPKKTLDPGEKRTFPGMINASSIPSDERTYRVKVVASDGVGGGSDTEFSDTYEL